MLCIPSNCNLAAFRQKRYLPVGCTFCKATRPLTWRQPRHARAPESHRCRPLIRASQTEAPEASTSGASMPVRTADGEMTAFPQTAGVYSIHSPDGQLQYIGLSRKVENVKSCGKSLTHMSDLLYGALPPVDLALIFPADCSQHCHPCTRLARADAQRPVGGNIWGQQGGHDCQMAGMAPGCRCHIGAHWQRLLHIRLCLCSRTFHFVFWVLPTRAMPRGPCACAVNETGSIPPGNAKGNTTWSIKRSAPKPELKLTPGKGLQDLTCSVEDLVDQVVKTNKVLLLFLPLFAGCERPALAHLPTPPSRTLCRKAFIMSCRWLLL